jgi:hypothetical protein
MLVTPQFSQLVLPLSVKMLKRFDAERISNIIRNGGVALLQPTKKQLDQLKIIYQSQESITQGLNDKYLNDRAKSALEQLHGKMKLWVKKLSPLTTENEMDESISFLHGKEEIQKGLRYDTSSIFLPHQDEINETLCTISLGGGTLKYPNGLIQKFRKKFEEGTFSSSQVEAFHRKYASEVFQVPDGVFSFHAGLYRDGENKLVLGALHSSPLLPQHRQPYRLKLMSYSELPPSNITTKDISDWWYKK